MNSKINKIIILISLISSTLYAGKSLEQYIVIEEPKELTPTELKLKKIKDEMGLTEVETVRVETSKTSSLRDTRKPENGQVDSQDLKLQKIKNEMGIEEPTKREKKLDKIRAELDIAYEVPQREGIYDSMKEKLDVSDSFEKRYDSVKYILSFSDSKKTKKTKSKDFSFSDTLTYFYDTVGLDEGESWGLPSVFGFNEKKKPRTFWGSKTLGKTFLGDIKDSGTMFYSGMKNSGQSAEMMSGMMYHNSRMYNKMFGVFDGSPLNIFEEEKETSIFDFVEGGNSVMEMFN